MWTLMTALQLLWVTYLATPSVGSQTGLAAVYGQPGDRLAGGPLACTGQPLRQDELVCAHRTLPCGTQILLQSRKTGRLATCRVLDRGPYGAKLPGGRFVIKTRPEARGTWRGIVDMSPAVAATLGVSTSEPVQMLFLRHGVTPPTRGTGQATDGRSHRHSPERRRPPRRPRGPVA